MGKLSISVLIFFAGIGGYIISSGYIIKRGQSNEENSVGMYSVINWLQNNCTYKRYGRDGKNIPKIGSLSLILWNQNCLRRAPENFSSDIHY